MTRLLYALFISLLLLPSLLVAKPHSTDPGLQVSKALNATLKNFGENINIGILVEDAKTGKILYSKNADRYFSPASNQKLFTAWTALQLLGPNFAYQTQIFVDPSKIQQGNLNDNVYLKFSGDPVFTSSQLDNLVNALEKAGIQSINGKIIIDDSAFDQDFWSPGFSVDDKKYCYGSPLSAEMIDHNCVQATIAPGAKEGDSTQLSLPPQPQFMNFVNHAHTGAPQDLSCKFKVDTSDNLNYIVSGCYSAKANPAPIEMAIANPRANLEAMLNYSLEHHHVKHLKQFEFKEVSTLPPVLASESSEPLPKLLSLMLKDSDNTIADALFKTIGAKYAGQTGTWKNGSEAMRSVTFNTLHIDVPASSLINGSGSSRYIYHTPQQMVALLRTALASPYADIFVQALPIAGVDGTLKERFQDNDTKAKIMAKTGSMSGLSSLSGILLTQKKHKLIFSIMINGFIDSSAKYKALEDKLCHELITIA